MDAGFSLVRLTKWILENKHKCVVVDDVMDVNVIVLFDISSGIANESFLLP